MEFISWCGGTDRACSVAERSSVFAKTKQVYSRDQRLAEIGGAFTSCSWMWTTHLRRTVRRTRAARYQSGPCLRSFVPIHAKSTVLHEFCLVFSVLLIFLHLLVYGEIQPFQVSEDVLFIASFSLRTFACFFGATRKSALASQSSSASALLSDSGFLYFVAGRLVHEAEKLSPQCKAVSIIAAGWTAGCATT